MDWTPCSDQELATMIAEGVAAMDARQRSLWNLSRIPPGKSQLHPWGDAGGGFWVVGILGQQAVSYNDIEGGFNVSRYETPEVIAEYWCNQDELQHTMSALLRPIETGQSPCKFGPPQPVT